jgi:mono/diheme cytochrome c family protein
VLALALLAGLHASGHAAPPDAALLARGEYLARIGGCAGCHTAPHGAPFAGGRGVPSPLGTIFSTNITPDDRHGIGRYSAEDFARAVREGTAPGGRHLYPAMPYVAYAKLRDEDLQALHAYLRHRVAPVAADPTPTTLPFPFDQRWALRFWKWLFLPRGPMPARADRDAEWKRGAYLVQSLGHCGACHTPRGLAFQERGLDESSRHFLAGAVNDHWYAPGLDPSPGAGLGRLDDAGLAAFLRTGQGAGLTAYGPMADEIEQSLQHLGDEDARAIVRYLKTLPERPGGGRYAPSARTERTPAQGNRTGDVASVGAAVYRGFCVQCHQADGMGVPQRFPRLAGNPSVLGEDPGSLIRIVVEGGRSPAVAGGPEAQHMPAFAGTLTDVQVAQVLTHVRGAWGNDARPVTLQDVTRLRKAIGK